ncbi:hypothetical protein [Mycobacterium sp.]|uniref:hypothetical protein n=1 Tax=Mycobacterium sp. TaxID=1785 RepID=UPI003D0CC797
MSTRDAIPACIEGYASYVGHADARRSLPELIFDVVSDALRAADCTMNDMDGVVIAAHDLVDGRSLSSMITGPAAGAYLRDEIRVSDDGLVAVSLAAARIQAGEAGKVIVAAWGRASEGDVERSSRVAFDPVTEQPLGLSDRAVSALRASAYLKLHDCPARERAAVERRRRAEASQRLLRTASCEAVFPLRPDEAGVPSDAVAAVVLSTEGPHVITGTGHGTDPARIGDRRIAQFEGARRAIADALATAGRTPAELTVAELGGLTLFDDALLLEAAGLAAPGAGLDCYADNAWINHVGGAAAGDCYPCRGLLRVVDALRHLDAQSHTRPAVALVAAGSAVADQTAAAVIIEAR